MMEFLGWYAGIGVAITGFLVAVIAVRGDEPDLPKVVMAIAFWPMLLVAFLVLTTIELFRK